MAHLVGCPGSVTSGSVLEPSNQKKLLQIHVYMYIRPGSVTSGSVLEPSNQKKLLQIHVYMYIHIYIHMYVVMEAIQSNNVRAYVSFYAMRAEGGPGTVGWSHESRASPAADSRTAGLL